MCIWVGVRGLSGGGWRKAVFSGVDSSALSCRRLERERLSDEELLDVGGWFWRGVVKIIFVELNMVRYECVLTFVLNRV